MNTVKLRTSRHQALAEIRRRFIAKGYPRLVVLAFVSFAGLAGFASSAALFRIGVEHMGYRYLGATAVGYLVFLLLIRAWMEFNRPRNRRDLDVPDFSGDVGTGGEPSVEFSGGTSGGGGASASWEGPDAPGVDVGLDVVDADEAWPVIAAIAVAAIVLLGGVVALLYVVYYAPLLLAEVALDAALVTGIYRKLRRQDTGHWLGSAIRRTWKPAVVIALCLFVGGSAIQWMAPAARTIGDILR
jgi:uncharacterized membrane protein YgcG